MFSTFLKPSSFSNLTDIFQFLINKDGSLDINIPKGSSFILSLPANRTVTYTWNIKNTIENGIIRTDSRSWIEIPLPRSAKGKDGANYDRQNFYFNTVNSGNEKIVLRYEPQTEQGNEYFEITFNVKIEK